MKQLAILLGVMLLDWAALHDIHAGEPDVWMEWSILGLSGLAFALLLWKALSLRRRDRA